MQRTIKEIKGLLWALVFALLIRTFLFQPFNIPSGSMYPTLMVGDYIFVTKYSYGFSKFSFPLAPNLFSGRIVESRKPETGEVIVFTNPKDQSMDYIKRLVGQPGDRIQMKEGVLHINGEPVKLEKIADYPMIDYRSNQLVVLSQYIETLPNGKQHKILKDIPFGKGPLDNTQEYIVPAGHYFMMGDNRDHSQDSRVLEAVGYIPEEFLIGPAKVIFFSTEAKWYELDNWISGLRPKRLLTMIA